MIDFAPPEGDTALPRVLVVDDDEVDRRVVVRHLTVGSAPFVVEETNDPTLALDMLEDGRYDCILLDYRFPSGTAFELFGEVMVQTCSNRPPIVLLTGQGDERIAADSIKLGAQEYLSKSDVSAESLRLAIEAAQLKAVHEREMIVRDEELMRMSFYDQLTDLPNRRLFRDRLEQATREASRGSDSFAVLMMDLNLFKEVNDTYGHEAGDELLQQVADRLQGVMRDSDTVARLGGDEFAAVLSTADCLEGAMVVAKKISEAVHEPVPIDGNVVDVGISVGIAMYPEHGTTADLLLRHADVALYQSKSATRGITVYGGHQDGRSRETAMISQGLQQAIERAELFTVYQPQVRLSDGAVVGAEALVRWRHPHLGLIPPSKFVPVAERSEVIEALTARVLGLSLAEAKGWLDRDLDLTVAVNLSARLLDRDGLVDRIGHLVDEAGVPHERLCLEVTETGLMQNPEMAEKTLGALSELGVQLSIDDFGTGYSSLKYLRNFPIDEIKIDGLFVNGVGDDDRDSVIVESVLALGSAFGVRVMAEGIDRESVWTRLRELGCEYGQGFLAGRPMSSLDFTRWLDSWDGGPALSFEQEMVGY